MNEALSGNTISSAQIYDGGNFNPITAEELQDNLLAIKQLINNYNEKTQKLESVEENLRDVMGELEFQNTYPFVAIFAAAANIIGTILVGLGVNMITNTPNTTKGGMVVLVLGGILVLFANAFTISYRWVRGWFNKKG